MGKVTDSIFDGASAVIPMKEVVFVQKDGRSGYEGNISVIFSGTTWASDIDTWNNNAYLVGREAKDFMRCWCKYRSEIESEDILIHQEADGRQVFDLMGLDQPKFPSL